MEWSAVSVVQVSLSALKNRSNCKPNEMEQNWKKEARVLLFDFAAAIFLRGMSLSHPLQTAGFTFH